MDMAKENKHESSTRKERKRMKVNNCETPSLNQATTKKS